MSSPFDLTGKRRPGAHKPVGKATVPATVEGGLSPEALLDAADEQPTPPPEPERDIDARSEPEPAGGTSYAAYTASRSTLPRPSSRELPVSRHRPQRSTPTAPPADPEPRAAALGREQPVKHTHLAPPPRPAHPAPPRPAERETPRPTGTEARAARPTPQPRTEGEAQAEPVPVLTPTATPAHGPARAAGDGPTTMARARGPTAGRGYQPRGAGRRPTTLTLSTEAADALDDLCAHFGMSKASVTSRALVKLRDAELAPPAPPTVEPAEAGPTADTLAAALSLILSALEQRKR